MRRGDLEGGARAWLGGEGAGRRQSRAVGPGAPEGFRVVFPLPGKSRLLGALFGDPGPRTQRGAAAEQ